MDFCILVLEMECHNSQIISADSVAGALKRTKSQETSKTQV